PFYAPAAGQPHDLGLQVGYVVIDAVIGAEREAGRDPRIRTRGRDYVGADYVLGDLNADRAEIAARAHDQHALAGFELGDVDEQIPAGRHVAHDHGGMVKSSLSGSSIAAQAGTATISAKPPSRLMPIIPVGPS